MEGCEKKVQETASKLIPWFPDMRVQNEKTFRGSKCYCVKSNPTVDILIYVTRD